MLIEDEYEIVQPSKKNALALLGAANSVASVVASISSDFKRSESTIHRDLRNIDIWGEEFFEIEFNPLVSAGKLSILFRDTMEVACLVLNMKRISIRHEPPRWLL